MPGTATVSRLGLASVAAVVLMAAATACDTKNTGTTPNRPPGTPTISSPSSGATFAPGQAISFQGSATDPEDGNLTGVRLAWTSSRDGQIGTGNSFSRSDLSSGSHTITLTATDSDGASRAATVSVTVESLPPETPEITSPTDGATFAVGENVSFEGSATDPEDGDLTGGSLVWTSDQDGQIGTGGSFSTSTLSEGDHTITLTATDSDGNSSSASIDITVANQPPNTPVITSPADGATFQVGAAVSFEGSADDPEDGALTGGSLVWTSDVDGQIGTGASFSTPTLSLGPHTITLTATDGGGLTSSASVDIEVQAAPTAAISAPANGATVLVGSSVTFTGSASDPEDGPLTGGALVWTSSIDGQIGTGLSFSTSALSAGPHTITLTATDSDGLTGTATIAISVQTAGSPTATITAPANNSSFQQGTLVTFTGSANDPEDGALTGGSLVWSSSLDGQIGTGLTFGTSTLSLGTHTITLTATDGDGLSGTASIAVTIQAPPTATITAPANGSTFAEGATVSFTGTGTDPEDGSLSGGSLVWTSSIDGQIGTGGSFNTTALSQGNHIITLTVTDGDGLTDTDQIGITVTPPGDPPVVTITAPADGGSAQVGASVGFTATATDTEDGNLTGGSLVWTSNLDGQIGTGASFSISTLSIGTHTITLTGTDSDGWVVTDEITFTITNDSPVATINAPTNGASVSEGTLVSFDGGATDTEDGALTGASLVWTSSIDGQIGTGETFDKSDLSVGTHTITLTATDSNGATGTDQVTLTVTSTASPIMVLMGSSASSSVVNGNQKVIPIVVDMSAAAGRDVASLSVKVTWNTGVATYVSASNQVGSGFSSVNDTNAGTGELILGWVDTTGQTSTFTIWNVTFQGASVGSTDITITVEEIRDETSADLSGDTGKRDHTLTVTN